MNKKVIERILKNLLENETYTLDKEETEILLNYIADLQRKEYNNEKAIEYLLDKYVRGLLDDNEVNNIVKISKGELKGGE